MLDHMDRSSVFAVSSSAYAVSKHAEGGNRTTSRERKTRSVECAGNNRILNGRHNLSLKLCWNRSNSVTASLAESCAVRTRVHASMLIKSFTRAFMQKLNLPNLTWLRSFSMKPALELQ